MKRRVVCTGLGLVTPVGCDRATTWAAIKAGTPGIRYLQETFPDIDVRIGGEVLDFEPVPGDERWERYIQFALKATDECLADAGLEITPDLAPRAATVVGSSKGGLKSLVVVHTCMLEGKLCPPDLFTNFLPNMPAAAVAARTGALGPVATSVAACATGAHCVIMGTNYVREGKADVALVGSTDASIIRPMVAGFNNMRLLASDDGDPGAACRPFSRDRTGFGIGEGAGVLCLETLDGARARGAKIYGEIAGTSWGADAYHYTSINPEAGNIARLIRLAIERAGLEPRDVGYLNAHGTGTLQNDALESAAIRQAFGPAAGSVAVSSTKSMIGHLLGGAGSVEMAFSLLALRDNFAPPTINLRVPDPECDLDYVPDVGREISTDASLSLSTGFGGQIGVIVARRV